MSILKVDTLQPATGSRVLSAGHIVQVVQGSTNTEVSGVNNLYRYYTFCIYYTNILIKQNFIVNQLPI